MLAPEAFHCTTIVQCCSIYGRAFSFQWYHILRRGTRAVCCVILYEYDLVNSVLRSRLRWKPCILHLFCLVFLPTNEHGRTQIGVDIDCNPPSCRWATSPHGLSRERWYATPQRGSSYDDTIQTRSLKSQWGAARTRKYFAVFYPSVETCTALTTYERTHHILDGNFRTALLLVPHGT